MPVTIGRRELIPALGSAAAWPLPARAQSAVPVIGFLSSLSSDYASYIAAAFRQGLTETGFAEGQSVKYEYRYANGDYSLLATMTDELVRRRVAIIAAGAPPAALAAKAATSTIPIVFVVGFDPIEAKLDPQEAARSARDSPIRALPISSRHMPSASASIQRYSPAIPCGPDS
jgi:putative tryptophan/tyrosine transport system substrate-binding protein